MLPRGVAIDQAMMNMDWLPSLLAAGGASSARGYAFDGVDLLPC
jgi:arylsulfatase A-like enzyme